MVQTIAITGGGTGGHIYPGLAVASFLKQKGDFRIVWIGSESPLDRQIVEGGGGGVVFYAIKSGKLRRYFSLKNISDILNIIAGFFGARKILKKERPLVVFSKGGFVSVPVCVAARSLKIKVVTHESDFSPGLATKINAVFADKICLSYDETAAFFARSTRKKCIVTGNPVRKEFYDASSDAGYSFLGVDKGKKILLVLGGSQGAKEINGLIEKCLAFLTERFVVVHQTGAADFDAAAKAQSDNYRPLAFIKEEMPDVLKAASLVIGRAGAGTVWECAVCGKPMLLIPLAGSGTRGDQVENARYFEKHGAAVSLVHPASETLVTKIQELLANPQAIADMGKKAANIGAKSAESAAEEVMSVIN
jgi:UDP-N-acetylglucosamine--N-acetylmuramyl-(pentapeptide) pyrophosphoryl-undecaprenol N-acetylglucosamine transferase